MSAVPQAVDDLAQMARDQVNEAHAYRMAMVHLIFGLRTHINHFHGALGEVEHMHEPMKIAMVGLREDMGRLLGKLEILGGIEGMTEGTAAETNCNGLLDFPKSGRLA
jgi:hypothetical protein